MLTSLNTRFFIAAGMSALLILSAGCAKPDSDSPSADGTISQKNFSGPELSVLLNEEKISNSPLKMDNAVVTGKIRSSRAEASRVLEKTTFEPDICKKYLLATYEDDPEIPAATGGTTIGPTVIRAQITSYQTAEDAGKVIESNRELAAKCPHFVNRVESKEQSYNISALSTSVPAPAESVALKISSGGNTSITSINRVGNLLLSVNFDGNNAEEVAKESGQSIQKIVEKLIKVLSK